MTEKQTTVFIVMENAQDPEQRFRGVFGTREAAERFVQAQPASPLVTLDVAEEPLQW